MLKRFVLPRAAEDGGSGAAPAADPAPATTEPAPASSAAPATTEPSAVFGVGGEAPASQDGKPADDAAKTEAPALTAESYADLKTPEDLPITNAAGLDAFKGLFAELGIPPEHAQKLVDLNAAQHRAAQAAAQEAQAKVSAEIAGWSDKAKADPEIGGDNFNKSTALADAALKAFGTPELGELIAASELGNHPELIRAFYRVGKAMQEDGRIASSGGAKPDRLAALYPTMVFKE